VSLAREARDVADYSHDLGRQDRADAEDLGEGGAGSLHLKPSIRLSSSAMRRSRVRRSPTTSAASPLRSRPAGYLGLARRNNLAAPSVESCFLRGSERRSRSRTWRRLRTRVRSQTRSSRLSVSSLKISVWPCGLSSAWTESPRSPFSTVGRRPRISQPSLWAAGRWRAIPI
jgi:hypothetical protein